jgi:5-methyltetrahydrofolate--homocysteine methyltransferase
MDFNSALEKHILVLDGAMGTMVQDLNLSDAAFGGAEFKMLTDLLVFSRPADLREIHLKYLRAGANLIETNTFGACPLRLREFDFSTLDPAGMQAVPEGLDLVRADHEAIARHLNIEAGRIAREAIELYRKEEGYDGRPLFVAGSIGPSNYVLSSTEADLKRTTFAVAEDNYRVQVAGLLEGGVDVVLFETQQDILETKAALFGARRAFDEAGRRLPVMVQVTVDGFSKMQIFNTDIEAAYVAVAGMGIDVFGINCNVGPDEMAASVEKMRRFSHHPVSVVPNAGQPVSEDGKTCYKLTPEAMADTLEAFVREGGVNIVGGCCGTTPAHIEALSGRVKQYAPAKPKPEGGIFVSGPQEAVALASASGLVRIGERLNVRGSKKVREAVETERGLNMDVLEEVVREQVSGLGMEIIDVCMDSNIVETEKLLPEVIQGLTSDFKGAMCIDSFSVEALAAAIQVYPGRPIVNSISLEEYKDGESKLDAVLKATAGHAPVYIALVNGPEGPAQTADEKYALAADIVRQAGEKFSVTPAQILIDVNAYPIGSESREGLNFCAETLKSLPRIKAIHPDLKTTIGVGNLTNGLGQKPYMRQVLTSVFLDEARRAGLDCAILNPNHYVPLESLPQHDVDLGRRVILERDMEAFEELEGVALTKKTGEVQKKVNYEGLSLEESICRKIRDGFKQKEEGTLSLDGKEYPYRDRIVVAAREVLGRYEPLEFISGHLMKTMRELGDAFGRGEVSLPHLLKSADVMRNVMGYLEWHMRVKSGAGEGEGAHHKGVVVLGTVYQDVHSIGKDLAKTLLENYGYRVIDLGVQVHLDRFIETARQESADAIGMSALLVQTSNHMITVARMLKDERLDIPVLIGGAPVNRRHAGFVAMHGQSEVGAIMDKVFYCESGMDGVNTMNTLVDPAARDHFIQENRDVLMREYQRAKGAREQEEKLLASLPRRRVSFKKHEVPKDGYGVHKVEFKLRQLASNLDVKSLYSLNWKFGKKSSWPQKGVTPQSLEALKTEWLAKAEENQWVRPRARFGLFPAQSDGDELIVYDPENPGRELGRIHFTVCIGKGQKDIFSVGQYFFSKSSGQVDAVGLQITTAGETVEPAVEAFKRQGDSESALYLQGLSDRVTEDLAEYIHRLMRRRAGHKNDRTGGQRYSPGYPALTGLINNRIIWEILGAEDIGIRLTGSNEFDPPSTTAAVVCFHSEAGYT